MTQQSTTAGKKSSAGAAPRSASSGKAAKSSAAKKSKAAAGGNGQNLINGEERHDMIATAAYFRAEQRCFDGDCAMDDWLAAEAEIDAMLYH